MDWHQGWPLIEARHIRPAAGRDIKATWSLGRMQSMTSPEVEVKDFMAANPVGHGVHWVTAMEVAIRVANWVRAGVTGEHVLAHGRWILDHLEPGRRNHYLANIVGLLFVASVERTHWADWATRELVAEIRHQFHDEGSNFEGSTAYHRLSLELASWGASLVTVPDDVMERLARARGFSEAMGTAVIGDDGGDRLFLDDADPLGLSPVVAGAGTIARDGKPGMRNRTEHRFDAPMRGRTLHAYPAFGAWVMRSERAHLAIRCGPRGQLGKGGHDHDDQLSITLSVDGQDVIRDPGTFAYTGDPDARNLYRSARVHFAPHAEGADPGSLDDGLFHLPGPDGTCLRWDESGFDGMMLLPHGRIARLRVEVDDEGITVVHGANVPLLPTRQVRWSPAYGVLSEETAPLTHSRTPPPWP